ncbi:MAG: endolytic transglycosylase MltG [Bacteroidia bacterium]|nr:endolytic transglycosylase MltG [Bacteroidia bacterium]
MKFFKKNLTVIFLIFIVLIVFSGINIFNKNNTNHTIIFIKSNDNSDSLILNLFKNKCLKNEYTFKIAAKLLQLNKVYGGMYSIEDGMSNYDLIKLFKLGKQIEVVFRFGNNVYQNELFGLLGKKYEADSTEFASTILDKNKLEVLALDSQSCLAMFWADTYQFPWTMKPTDLVNNFIKDQQIFWNTERMQKLADCGFKSTKEVYILASIVEKEAVKKEEMPIIAGVYINRLKRNMLLQADPTVKYANGINKMSRVKGILDTISPYNTYKNLGLPPGPIGLCSKSAVDSVLNYKKHNYLYFCAKEDFSNYHYFTENFAQHRILAAKYRAALDKRGIK